MARKETDSRSEPPVDASERAMLVNWLDWERATVLWKVSGLTDEQLRRRLVPSATTMLGIVKHLGYVEQSWFQRRFEGQKMAVPWTEADPDADFRIEPGESTQAVLAWYEEQVARSRAIEAAASSLDQQTMDLERAGYSLRWIMVHMIEETARHNGHLDILREQIDGSTGE